MLINSIEYIGSWNKLEDCPKDVRPEYAFIGRSNVGKSSLINLISSRKKVAKVSGTPGKTQMINFFDVNENYYLVDLPGYGYARISKKKREQWRLMIHNYLKNRDALRCIFVLIDSRITPQKIDLEFIDFLGKNQLAFVLVFTKIDGKKSAVTETNIDNFKSELLKTWEQLPQCFETSAVEKIGADEILAFIEQINGLNN